MSILSLTDWELTSISQSTWAGVSVLLKFGAGVVPIEFTNKKKGSVTSFNLGFLGAGFGLPVSWSSNLFTKPWLSMQSNRLITTFTAPSDFSIDSLKGKYAAVSTIGAAASSLGFIAFSRVPLTPIYIGGAAFSLAIFAGCVFTAPTTVYGSLSAGMLSCQVDS
jgi:hypothetical protein